MLPANVGVKDSMFVVTSTSRGKFPGCVPCVCQAQDLSHACTPPVRNRFCGPKSLTLRPETGTCCFLSTGKPSPPWWSGHMAPTLRNTDLFCVVSKRGGSLSASVWTGWPVAMYSSCPAPCRFDFVVPAIKLNVLPPPSRTRGHTRCPKLQHVQWLNWKEGVAILLKIVDSPNLNKFLNCSGSIETPVVCCGGIHKDPFPTQTPRVAG